MKPASRLRGLYAIADTGLLHDSRLTGAVEEALLGGARIIQYRDKSEDAARRLRQARLLARLCRASAAVFLVNDDAELARQAIADGVHLGRDDGSVAAARRLLGNGALIGVSCYNDYARADAAVAAGADYIAFGSFFPSATKPEAVRAEVALLQRARTGLSVPVVAIGGITPENGATLINAGAHALAVITGVFDQPDVCAAAKRYAALFGNTSI